MIISDSGRPEYPTVTNRWVIQTKDQQRNFRANQQHTAEKLTGDRIREEIKKDPMKMKI
jgi:hypothetical protein